MLACISKVLSRRRSLGGWPCPRRLLERVSVVATVALALSSVRL